MTGRRMPRSTGPEDVRNVYELGAEAFDRTRDRSLLERAWLDRLAALAPPGAPALDLGCGAGEPIARALIERGHPVTGVDFAAAMIAIARGRFPDQTWIEGDMRELDLGRRFGLAVAWDSFFHLSREDQRAAIPIFARHLDPGGGLLFTSGPADGEAIGAVDGRPVYHASLAPAAYAALLEASGLNLRAFVAEDPACGRSVWLAQRA